MNTSFLSPLQKLSLAVLTVSLSAIYSASAANVYWIGTNGVSPDVNWSNAANFLTINTTTPTNPANNEANFNWNTTVASAGLVTINVDGPYPGQSTSGANSGSPQAWGMYFTQTNGYQTVFIQPGITLALQAANAGTGGGNLAIDPGSTNNGSSSQGNSVSPGVPYTNYTTFTGIGGTFFANTATMRIEAQSTTVMNHYTIWDMSGLGTYIFTNTGASSMNIYCSDSETRGNTMIYLAHTNFITMNTGGGQIHICNESSSGQQLAAHRHLPGADQLHPDRQFQQQPVDWRHGLPGRRFPAI